MGGCLFQSCFIFISLISHLPGMRNYEVEPLVSIQGEGIVNTFYPSRIDNSKIFVGCQSSAFWKVRFTSRLGCPVH